MLHVTKRGMRNPPRNRYGSSTALSKFAGGPGDGALGEGQEEVVAPACAGVSRGLMRVWLVGGRGWGGLVVPWTLVWAGWLKIMGSLSNRHLPCLRKGEEEA